MNDLLALEIHAKYRYEQALSEAVQRRLLRPRQSRRHSRPGLTLSPGASHRPETDPSTENNMRGLILNALKAVARLITGPQHGPAKSFEHEVERAGVTSRVDAGMKTIPAVKIVGSVGRAGNLRSDFFYKTGPAMTARFVRVGQAMEAGKVLPPIEVYKARLRRRRGEREDERTEYYVVDGHHRVAMAKKLGQDYLDAHVVEYRVSSGPGAAATPSTARRPPFIRR